MVLSRFIDEQIFFYDTKHGKCLPICSTLHCTAKDCCKINSTPNGHAPTDVKLIYSPTKDRYEEYQNIHVHDGTIT
jgi:hypothetical protein